MSDDGFDSGSFWLGVACGLMLMGTACLMTPDRSWQRQAIEHNAARYSATTGKFEWIERSDGK